MSERWPPIYDYESLLATIKDLIVHDKLVSNFFEANPEDAFYQGDIVKFEVPQLVINADGKPEKIDSSGYWIILSNSCDLARTISDSPWAQIVPIELLGNLRSSDVERFSRYQTSRKFYVPPWGDEVKGLHGIADFCKPLTVNRAGLVAHAKLLARLTMHSWILLHCCLVRFLARDDGRYDPN